MAFAPQTLYKDSQTHPTTAVLEAAGDVELPDANLTEMQRLALKELAHRLGPRLSSHEFVFLASTVEVEAHAKREKEYSAS